MHVKFLNLNMRIDVEDDGANRFVHRLPLITDLVREEEPEILCFQEVYLRMQIGLTEALPDHYVWLGRSRSADWTDEFVLIGFDNRRFFLRDYRQNWMSYTPDEPGSRYPKQSICPRSFSIALLEDRKTQGLLILAVTHLDHESEQARLLGMTQVLGEIHRMCQRVALPGIPIILAGDFNAEPDEACIRLAISMPLGIDGEDRLRDLAVDLPGTFHDFGRSLRKEKIDYVLASPQVLAESIRLLDKHEGGRYYSDHSAILAELEITDCHAPNLERAFS